MSGALGQAQIIPAAGPGRRALQDKGQFWTPDWVAEAMLAYVLGHRPQTLFDPAVGPGTFFAASRRLGFSGRFAGYENDAAALDAAIENGLSHSDLENITVADFFNMPAAQYPAIISNPPYIRHHRIPAGLKARLQTETRARLGLEIDGRAGLHVYFFIRCLQQLAPGGRLIFIVSSDLCEGVFARRLWSWVSAHYRLRAVATFASDAAPFPGVDTNALIVALENTPPESHFAWACVHTRDARALSRFLSAPEAAEADDTLSVVQRETAEAIATGLSRPPPAITTGGGVRLGALACVMRGIATGANDFFLLTQAQLRRHGLSEKWFVRAVGRTRDCPVEILTRERLDHLEAEGRPTWLLDLPARPMAELPAAVQAYLAGGERQGLPQRPLIAQRKLWYRMEQRKVPPILFAYLGRRACRFILNQAGALPLTGFLCVYPNLDRVSDVTEFWKLLNTPECLEGLAAVGKSYGAGAIKVEPRALENLLLPSALMKQHGIEVSLPTQWRLMEPKSGYDVRSAGKRPSSRSNSKRR